MGKPEKDTRFNKFGTVSFTQTTAVNDFIDHLEDNKVMGTHCKACDLSFFPPRRDCCGCQSSDLEWFGYTVIAHGNHIATWVNGYQAADFTDTRKVGKNARRQCRLEGGVISLQGHDPTTNLSFRHVRVAEYPKAD